MISDLIDAMPPTRSSASRRIRSRLVTLIGISTRIRARFKPPRRRKSCGHKHHENDHRTERDVKAAMPSGVRPRRGHLYRWSSRSRRTRAGQRRGRHRHGCSLCLETCRHALQRISKRIRRLEPLGWFLRKRHQDDLVQRCRQIRAELHGRPRRLLQLRLHNQKMVC